MPKKKSKLTPEQLAAKKEAEAKEAAELRAKKTELLTAFLKEKLEQEERNTRISLKKLNEQWRAILRKTKSAELRKDIAILEQTFKRQLDRRDDTIKSLVRNLAEAERQENMALQTHIQNVDRLVEFHESLATEKHDRFNDDVQALKEEFLEERERILARHAIESGNIKDMMFAMQMKFEDDETMVAEEFNSKRDEIKNEHNEAVEAVKQELEKTIGDLWEQFTTALNNYKQSTEKKRAEFTVLQQRDDEDAKKIRKEMLKLNKITDAIQECKLRLATNQKEWEGRNKQLKTEKESVLRHFQRLKDRMNKSRARERTLLTELTVESRAALDALKARQDEAQGLLRQAEMCRKLETEQEKVLPFYSDSVTAEEVAAAAVAELGAVPAEAEGAEGAGGGAAEELPMAHASATDLVTKRPLGKHDMMHNFWKRFNKAQLDKLAAEKEREVLETENTRLRAILKQYLDGISVSESVLQQQNTLMVVNYKTNAPVGLGSVPVGDSRVALARRGEVQLEVAGAGAAVPIAEVP